MVKSLITRTYNHAQSWYFEELMEAEDGSRLRVKIRSNAYDFQSSGTIERWDGTKWQQVAHRAGEELASRQGDHNERRPVNYTDKSLAPEGFAQFLSDRDALVAEATLVLQTN